MVGVLSFSLWLLLDEVLYRIQNIPVAAKSNNDVSSSSCLISDMNTQSNMQILLLVFIRSCHCFFPCFFYSVVTDLNWLAVTHRTLVNEAELQWQISADRKKEKVDQVYWFRREWRKWRRLKRRPHKSWKQPERHSRQKVSRSDRKISKQESRSQHNTHISRWLSIELFGSIHS